MWQQHFLRGAGIFGKQSNEVINAAYQIPEVTSGRSMVYCIYKTSKGSHLHIQNPQSKQKGERKPPVAFRLELTDGQILAMGV